jgi:hypothetical protein
MVIKGCGGDGLWWAGESIGRLFLWAETTCGPGLGVWTAKLGFIKMRGLLGRAALARTMASLDKGKPFP